ncbi:MAG: class I SAM-dependent methyltransferase [Chloroflexota bacterium]
MFPSPPSSPISPDPRIDLHVRFSTNKKGMAPWFLEQLSLPADAHVLELGCGSGNIWLTNLPRIPQGWRLLLSDSDPEKYAGPQRALQQDRGFSFQTIDPNRPLPFENERFDAVIGLYLLDRLESIPAALGEIYRVLKPKGKLYAAAYGEKHMDELYSLFVRFNPQTATLGRRVTRQMKFSLENGSKQLRQFFWDVQQRRYEDALEVTQAKPLFDYILAMSGMRQDAENQAALYTLAAFIDQEIKEKGAIHISKAEGIFVATK